MMQVTGIRGVDLHAVKTLSEREEVSVTSLVHSSPKNTPTTIIQ